MTFNNQIITQLEQNGTIEAGMIFEFSFTNINVQGLPFDLGEASVFLIKFVFG